MANENETIVDIVAELRDVSKADRYTVKANPQLLSPTVLGKPICAYFAEAADRIEEAAKRDYEYPKAQSLDADKLTGKNISGLATDLRQIAKYHYARGNIVQGQFARVMADRIEAAWKRERDHLLNEIANAAAGF